MKTIGSYIAMLEGTGYTLSDYEVFKTNDGNLCLRIWENTNRFRKVLFTAEGKFIKELATVNAF